MLLWQPAVTVAELKPQQNIIAVLVDDSRSMAIPDGGAARESQAVPVLPGTACYPICKRSTRRDSTGWMAASAELKTSTILHASAAATHIGDSLKQFVGGHGGPANRSDRSAGAMGPDNSGGIDLETISARSATGEFPVHTVGFGQEQAGKDVELDDASISPRALADSRLAARISFHQHGYDGR